MAAAVVFLVGKGRAVPAHDDLAPIGTVVKGQHLTVEVLADGDLVATLGVRDGEAVGNFDGGPDRDGPGGSR